MPLKNTWWYKIRHTSNYRSCLAHSMVKMSSKRLIVSPMQPHYLTNACYFQSPQPTAQNALYADILKTNSAPVLKPQPKPNSNPFWKQSEHLYSIILKINFKQIQWALKWKRIRYIPCIIRTAVHSIRGCGQKTTFYCVFDITADFSVVIIFFSFWGLEGTWQELAKVS